MDNDEYDFDDIPDEDMILVAAEAEKEAVAASTARTASTASFSQFGRQPAVASTRPLAPVLPPNLSNNNTRDANSAVTKYPPSNRPPGQSQNLRQTTLWGGTLQESGVPSSQSSAAKNRPYLADLPPEKPTHHELNQEELSTWVYPMNLGPIRDYQFSIVKNALFHNTLVALPTGLGKTFIAATVMLNYFRWTKRAKLVFVAPTKPLASQQVEACLGIAGIPRSQASLLTGEIPPVVREEEWDRKRVFFMTPQTLTNDLSKGYADPKSIVLLVVDEAHRATGDYAYVKAVEFIRRFNESFRILALTATPGSKIDGVQEIIDNLGISHVEIRTEESIDIRQYVHSRDIDTKTFDPSAEMRQVQQLWWTN
jgi:ATP-dependent DNA helicase MPH1